MGQNGQLPSSCPILGAHLGQQGPQGQGHMGRVTLGGTMAGWQGVQEARVEARGTEGDRRESKLEG
jgi:hypothetical protein